MLHQMKKCDNRVNAFERLAKQLGGDSLCVGVVEQLVEGLQERSS